jgi:nitrite reductase/ring-hydroxylating ferredoxin subunit
MLSAEQNELITRVGPGTPMGETLRRYWMPAVMSSELPEPDGAPVRVRLLGETLVAFRDTTGRVGLVDEYCPHRGASLWLGRNEECGLRCIYHGWKFDADGNCVDQMNEPEPFAQKVKVTAYPTIEVGDVVWAYMGPKELMPPPPNFEWTQVPPSHRHVSKVWQECNWVQALEGGIDTSHAPILHRALTPGGPGINPNSPFVRGRAPHLEVDVTDYGYRYFGVRDLDEDKRYVRGYHFVLPFHQIRPQQVPNQGLGDGEGDRQAMIAGHMWVPMDDHNTMVWNWNLAIGETPISEEQRLERGIGNGPDFVDAANGFRSRQGRWNNWGIDRQRQKTVNFSGILGINQQDRAVQESMGYIVDRSKEHLGPADRAIIVMRQLLLQAERTVREGGDPPGTGDSYYRVRAWEAVLPRTADWRAELLPLMDPAESQREPAVV